MPRVRTKTSRAARSAPVPWWLQAGEEECPHCGQLYTLALEVRCHRCDGPSCIHCKVRVTENEIVCPECLESDTDG